MTCEKKNETEKPLFPAEINKNIWLLRKNAACGMMSMELFFMEIDKKKWTSLDNNNGQMEINFGILT